MDLNVFLFGAGTIFGFLIGLSAWVIVMALRNIVIKRALKDVKK